MKLKETPTNKIISSTFYNSILNKVSGKFIRWGKTTENNPSWCEFGPEILDIEISSVVDKKEVVLNENTILTSGACNGRGCKQFCYKDNGTGNFTAHMSLIGFKKILDKLPKTVGQIAFGITSLNSHPELWKIFEECRNNDIVPNLTINGIDVSNDNAKELKRYCGAVAVSVNKVNQEEAFNTIQLLSQTYHMNQINIHYVLSEQTHEDALFLIKEASEDERLDKLNAIVFLMYKHKNKSCKYDSLLDVAKYKELVETANKYGIGIGMDSCSSDMYLASIKNDKHFEELKQCVEPCESGKFSWYIDYKGEAFPCSFCPGENKWESGIDIYKVNNFVDEVWMNKRVKEWRLNLSDRKRSCPIFKLTPKGNK